MRPSTDRFIAAACSGILAVAALTAVVLAVPAAARAGCDVPLSTGSPWPKFHRDSVQDGRSPLRPSITGGSLWTVRTGGGIFASPIIGADGTVYVGSADRQFWAVSSSGQVRWRFRTGEIIDSAGLLDNRGRVYVPSGDGHIYALDARTGAREWSFAALPASATGAFINWFEGNVAIGPAGTLYAPNDGFRTYAIDRVTGRALWALPTHDQTWSLPAVDAATGKLYIGNNFFLGGAPNVFGITPTGSPEWSAEVNGSVVASPLLTRSGLVIVGGFDGYVHAYDRATGAQRWQFATRDHIYSSAAQLSNGTIVTASTDGTIYGLDPRSGRERWHYDTLNPIRSSPAVDGDDDVYIGTGDGRILVLNRDGERLWALRVTNDPRATLNASPALGRNVIVDADSEGSIFSVPFDFCLRPAQRRNRSCERGGSEGLKANRARLYWTSRFGVLQGSPPTSIGADRPIALSLVVRRRDATRLALIDRSGLRVRVTPSVPLRVSVSGDRRYLVVAPRVRYRGRRVVLSVSGRYLVGLRRRGLAFSGGHVGGRFTQRFALTLTRGSTGSSLGGAKVWSLTRLALPLPDLLPSYNQIGFERLDFLVSVVKPFGGGRALMWLVGGRPGHGGVVPDPSTQYRVAYTGTVQNGLLGLTDAGNSAINLNGFNIQTTSWRWAVTLGRHGTPAGDPITTLEVNCAKIGFYGPFLEQLGLCGSSRPMQIFGAAQMAKAGSALVQAPRGVGRVTFTRAGGALVAHIAGSSLRSASTAFGVLVTDARERPLPLPYGTGTKVTAAPNGTVTTVSVPLVGRGASAARAYLMVGSAVGASGPVSG